MFRWHSSFRIYRVLKLLIGTSFLMSIVLLRFDGLHRLLNLFPFFDRLIVVTFWKKFKRCLDDIHHFVSTEFYSIWRGPTKFYEISLFFFEGFTVFYWVYTGFFQIWSGLSELAGLLYGFWPCHGETRYKSCRLFEIQNWETLPMHGSNLSRCSGWSFTEFIELWGERRATATADQGRPVFLFSLRSAVCVFFRFWRRTATAAATNELKKKWTWSALDRRSTSRFLQRETGRRNEWTVAPFTRLSVSNWNKVAQHLRKKFFSQCLFYCWLIAVVCFL